MKIGLILSSIYASEALFGKRIFAPRDLFVNLADGLVAKGHSVSVFSVPDLNTKATVIGSSLKYVMEKTPYHKFLKLEPSKRVWLTEEFAKRNFEIDVITNAFRAAQKGEVDILHSYHDSSLFLAHYLNSLHDFPVLHSLHDPLPPQNSFEYEELTKFKNHQYVAISESQKEGDLSLSYAGTIYHGIDLDAFPFQREASDYVLFMGRLVPEKGLHTAIAVALALNIQLEIGTQFPKGDENEYFNTHIKPFLDNPLVGEPGMVEGKNKQTLYKQAKALLFPIEWEEPFGIVMVEAMACGTPVIAYNRGSVSEIVRDGVTGFIIEPDDIENSKLQNPNFKKMTNSKFQIQKRGIEGLIEAVNRIDEIDRRNCRKHVEDHFTVERMVEGYERVYKKILSTKSSSNF